MKLPYRVQLRLAKLCNVAMMAVPPVVCWISSYGKNMSEGAAMTGLIAIAFVALYVTYGRIYESFLISLVRISEMIYSQCLALVMSDALLYVMITLAARRFVSVVPMLAVFGVQVVLSVLWCTLAHIWYFRKHPPKRSVIIYDRNRDIGDLIGAYGLEKKFAVCRTLTIGECVQEGFGQLEGIETIFLCGVKSHERNLIVKHCVEHNIMVYVMPRIGDVIMSGAKRMHLFHLPFLRVQRYDPAPEYVLAKRLFDVAVSAVALLALSPVLLVTAAAIKLTDGGPVFYRQTRLTKDGKEFKLLKFRSMRQDAEKDGVARLSTGDSDPRITPVGRFIRKVRIDELPELINILQGSMSVVGPRPERPEIASQYEQELPEFSLRLQAKAGLTGYAQVYGKYNTTPYDKLQMDLMYIAHPSFWEDLRIIFATIKILFIPESTEGVAAGMVTAIDDRKEEKEKVEV